MGMMTLEPLEAPAPWEAYRARVSAFPAPEAELASVRRFWQALSAAAVGAWKLSAEVFLQFAQLHLGDVYCRLSAHGREWIPETGLGVWPDREAPHLWTAKEFLDLAPGSAPVLMYQLLRVTTGPQEREKARDTMLGFGTVLEVLGADGSEAFLKKGKETFLPGITDPIFRVYPFYVALLEASTVRNAKAGDLEKWLCGAKVYVRESAEDQGVMIVSREPLGPVLQKLGGKRQAANWEMPY